MRQARLVHEFVEYIPEHLKEGVLYVSMSFAVASHKCVCGCGREVVTPLSPTDWQLWFDGQGVSLEPSIGNWNFPCRSHYWIRGNIISWAADMPQWAIEQGRVHGRLAKEKYYASKELRLPESSLQQLPAPPVQVPKVVSQPWWVALMARFKLRP